MQRTLRLLGVAIVFIQAASATSTASGQVNDPASSQWNGIPADWLAEYTAEIDAQVERFGTAYSLTPDAREALRQTLVAKLPEQWSFASKGFQSVQQKLDDAIARGVDLEADTEENRAIMNQFVQIGEIGPLADMVVAKELESRMDPVVAEQGRTRLVDLLTRRDQIVSARDDDFELQSGHNGSLSDAKLAAEAPLTAEGPPMPRGEKLSEVAPEAVGKIGGAPPPTAPIQPNSVAAMAASMTGETVGAVAPDHSAAKPDLKKVQAAADALLAEPGKASPGDLTVAAANGRTAKAAAATNGRDHAAAPSTDAARPPTKAQEPSFSAHQDKGASRPMPAAVEAVRLQAAPPLDDWDKYVDATCKKFGFTDAQVIKAQSILKDLRNRAASYRTSRNEDFAAAERITDAKAKADRKKELSAPIDAFFEELKQRLDNLATLEQRAKAATPATPKK